MKSNQTIFYVLKSAFKFWLILLFAVTSQLLYAQVSGTITDASTNEALIGASVVIKGTSIGTTTDSFLCRL